MSVLYFQIPSFFLLENVLPTWIPCLQKNQSVVPPIFLLQPFRYICLGQFSPATHLSIEVLGSHRGNNEGKGDVYSSFPQIQSPAHLLHPFLLPSNCPTYLSSLKKKKRTSMPRKRFSSFLSPVIIFWITNMHPKWKQKHAHYAHGIAFNRKYNPMEIWPCTSKYILQQLNMVFSFHSGKLELGLGNFQTRF